MTAGMVPSSPRRSPRPRRMLGLALSGVLALVLSGITGCSLASQDAPVLRGHLSIAGSTALQPLAKAAADEYMKQHPDVTIDVQGGGSKTGLQQVSGGKVDIGMSDIYADPAIYPDPNLTDHLVALVPFAMIVNSAVTVPTLTRDQIIKIFSTGEITNWKQVGGPDLDITPVVRPGTSGTRATFRRYVLGGRDESATPLNSDSSQTVRDTVAQTKGAIGYLALTYVDASVRVVNIDGQGPTGANIAAGRYPFWSYEHMYTLGEDNEAVVSFLTFMLSDRVQRIAQETGYIPVDTGRGQGSQGEPTAPPKATQTSKTSLVRPARPADAPREAPYVAA